MKRKCERKRKRFEAQLAIVKLIYYFMHFRTMKMQTVNCTPLSFGRTFHNATATSDRIEIKFKLVLQVKLHENALNTENYEINSLLIEFSTMNHFFLVFMPAAYVH